jgi:hypothetical protein
VSKENLVLVKRHWVPKGRKVLCNEVYRCDGCHHQTGTVRVERHGTTDQAAAR